MSRLIEAAMYYGSDPTANAALGNIRLERKRIVRQRQSERRRTHRERNVHEKRAGSLIQLNGEVAHQGTIMRSQREIGLIENQLAQLRILRAKQGITAIKYEAEKVPLVQRLHSIQDSAEHKPKRPTKKFTRHGIPT